MPLYEIGSSGDLVPFRRLAGGADLYEHEIETLLWTNPDEFLGESLLLVARQPTLVAGGRPDVVALASDARVVVFEVKRDVDRGQLAQCLEYAGWARTTSLDELAGMYHRGPNAFFSDWQEFTGDAAPAVIVRRPKLVLIAHSFHGRTQSAFDFLIENGLPVQVIEVSVYEDAQGRRFVNIGGEHEPEIPAITDSLRAGASSTLVDGRRVTIADLIEAELLAPGAVLRWDRPRLGAHYVARITENAAIELDDGRSFATPSRAAKAAANIPAYDGWYAWHLDDPDGSINLNDLRQKFIARMSEDTSA